MHCGSFWKDIVNPNRYSDMIFRFGRPVPQLSIISSQILNDLYLRFGNLLLDFDPISIPFFLPHQLEMYCQAIATAGAGDRTVRPICRPVQFQRMVYKRVHALKYKSFVMEGRRHDTRMVAMSNLLPSLLQRHAKDTQGRPLCIYGDPAYPIRVSLQCQFWNVNLTPAKAAFNQSMKEVIKLWN